MKMRIVVFSLLLSLAAPLISLPAGVKPGDLPEKYRKWLNEEVVYIISQKEKEIFFKLESDRERDIFIEAFWKQRDPSPGTEENEFKTEHFRRIQYSNQWYGRGTSTPGWKTDRGKTYIILGKPETVESYGQTGMVVPIEVWFYQNAPGHGLPQAFYVVFFQQDNVGDYIYYSPVRHGPRKLLESFQENPTEAYQYLKKYNPVLAGVSISLVPGEGQTSYTNPKPSLSSELLLHSIEAYPQKQIDESYAEKLFKYKEIIEVDHSVNYIGNDSLIKVFPDPAGFSFVHYAVEPERLSLASDKDGYSVELKAFGKITDEKDVTVYQFEKAVPLEFGSENLDELKKKRFSFQDVFPLLPGRYKFDLLLKNAVSKEFTSIERTLVIPAPSSGPKISPLVLSFRDKIHEAGKKGFRPFQFGRIQLYPQAQMLFAPDDDLFVYFQIADLPRDVTEKAKLTFLIGENEKTTLEETCRLSDVKQDLGFIKRFKLGTIPPGMYTLTVSLNGEDGSVILTEKENFVVSPVANVPRAWSLSKVFPDPGDPYYTHILGTQYLNAGAVDKAAVLFEECRLKKPDSLQFAISSIQAQYLLKNYPKIMEIAEPFAAMTDREPALHFYLGKAAQSLGDYSVAASHYRDYLSHFGTHLDVLNSLGECYFQSGDKAQARKIWEKSLEIDPKQEKIRGFLEKMDKGD